ncbi:hypothetical protein ACFSL4_26295 [Streptomyces caeni]|uniref:Uncharacterized protein n=1 Tax=Streptomyces caeni TaxID=2307231 RepID=A0ABW4IZA6_9ACTN
MVRRGQQVRVWGEWRTVVGVRDERDAAGAPAVVPAPDKDPALRVRATEPLAVRQGGGGVVHG